MDIKEKMQLVPVFTYHVKVRIYYFMLIYANNERQIINPPYKTNWSGLWCLTSLSTMFQLYHGSHFYWWRKPGVPGENHRPVTSPWQTLSHKVVSSTPRYERGSDSQLKWWWALIALVVVNPTTIDHDYDVPQLLWKEGYIYFLYSFADS